MALGRWLLTLVAAWPQVAASPASPRLRGGDNATLQGLVAPSKSFSHMAWAPFPEYCLSSDSNRVENGVKIQLWKCDSSWGSVGQLFDLGGDGRIRMSFNPAYCVVIDGDRLENGAQIQVWKCDERNHHQAWSFGHAGQLQASSSEGSMCLVIDGNGARNGAKIQLWECGNARSVGTLQDWLQVALGPGGLAAYAVPAADRACTPPFYPVSNMGACASAAEALRPGQGCYEKRWSEVVSTRHRPSWPQGCAFEAGCGGGCSLGWNPLGRGAACPKQGACMRIDVLCEQRVR